MMLSQAGFTLYPTSKWDSSHCLSTQGPCSNHDLKPQVFTQNPGESAVFPWDVTGICILKKFPRQFDICNKLKPAQSKTYPKKMSLTLFNMIYKTVKSVKEETLWNFLKY